MARIEVNDLVSFIKIVEQHKGKYIKLTLSNVEMSGKLDRELRKIILDGMNSFARAVYKTCGYDVED